MIVILIISWVIVPISVNAEEKPAKTMKGIDLAEYRGKSIKKLEKKVKLNKVKKKKNTYEDSKKIVKITTTKKGKIKEIAINMPQKGKKYVPTFAGLKPGMDFDNEIIERELNIDVYPYMNLVAEDSGQDTIYIQESKTYNLLSIVPDKKSSTNKDKKISCIKWKANGIDIESESDMQKFYTIEEMEARDGEKKSEDLEAPQISGSFDVDVNAGLLYGDIKSGHITDKDGNILRDYDNQGYSLSNAGTIIGPTEADAHFYQLEEGTNKIIPNTALSSGYTNITSIAESIIKNNEDIVGQKVAFCGMAIYHDSNKIELSYFEGEAHETLVTAYFDSDKMPTMGDVEPLYMANTIVWGTVKEISEAFGVEIDLDAMNVSSKDLWFTEFYSYEYQEVFYADEACAADFGEKLMLEGIVQTENGKAHNLVLDDGSICELWGGMSGELSSVGELAIYDSFIGVRVKVYGRLTSGKPALSVDYIEPIIQ